MVDLKDVASESAIDNPDHLNSLKFFQFQEDSYELFTDYINEHVINHSHYGDNYFQQLPSTFAREELEQIRNDSAVFIKEQASINSLCISWLRVASEKVLRVGHSLLCWSTPEDDAGERLLMADFNPYQQLENISCLIMLKSVKRKVPETSVVVEQYTEFPLMIVHKDFGDEVKRHLQQITRQREPMRNARMESFFDIPTYSCQGNNRVATLSKYDASDANEDSHRLYSVDVLEKIQTGSQTYIKRQSIATVREDGVKERENAYLIFAIYYQECIKVLKGVELPNYQVHQDSSVSAGFLHAGEEMCRISPTFNPELAKVLVACLRARPEAELLGEERKSFFPSTSYFKMNRVNENEFMTGQEYAFFISTVDGDVLLETNHPIVATLAYHELSRMFAGCQEIYNRSDPSVNVRITESRLNGRGDFIIEEEKPDDLTFKGEFGRGGRNEESQKLHGYLKKKGVIGKQEEEVKKKRRGLFGLFGSKK